MIYWIFGFLLTSVVGYFGVPRFLEWIRERLRPPDLASRDAINTAWSALTQHPKASGDWVGICERVIFFWALYDTRWEAVGIWIAFKVAAKWEARNHLAYVPEVVEGVPPLDWAAARRIWAAREYATFVVGTAANLLLAAAGVLIGRHGPTVIQAVNL